MSKGYNPIKRRAEYLRNKKVYLSRSRDYYADHKENYRKVRHAWYERKKKDSSFLLKRKQYQLDHFEKYKIYSSNYRKRHPDALACSRRRYRFKHPDRVAIMKRIRRNRELGASGSHTYQQWLDLKKFYNYTCPACLRMEPEIKLTEDHIKPLSRGGSDYIINIQPLCVSCNSKKHTQDIQYNEEICRISIDPQLYEIYSR